MATAVTFQAATGAKAVISPLEQLTDRELQVFRLIGEGNSTRQIAAQLHLSVRTVEAYRRVVEVNQFGTFLGMRRTLRWGRRLVRRSTGREVRARPATASAPSPVAVIDSPAQAATPAPHFRLSRYLSHREYNALLGIAVAGGMFVVPLYAFLTTTVPKAQAARTVAANNIVNSGAMVTGSLLAVGMSVAGMPTADQLLLAAAMCLISAWLAWKLHKACDDGACVDAEDLPPDV